jgi:two-component system, NarL family, sensor histidine kinase UhpB
VLPPLSAEEELVFYRVAQEALTNVVRHAGCDRAELSLQVVDGELVLDVRDRGRGFEVDGAAANGLLGMRERALLVGGRLELRSGPGRGTLVRLALPLEQAA